MNYKLLDSGYFQKYEQIGRFRIVRPSPQAVWKSEVPPKEWLKNCDAYYERYSEGKGDWKVKNKEIEKPFQAEFNTSIQMILKLTSFGHLGAFMEQVPNWKLLSDFASTALKQNSTFKVLNLFAYTGGATCSLAQRGCEVVHLDASKTSVQWAKENAQASSLEEAKIRWIVDDAQKFVQKEVRRGSKYHGIILDPPSYGRGAGSEVWKIEEDLFTLLENLKQLMDDNFGFIQLSSHSQGYTPIALENLLKEMCKNFEGKYITEEMFVEDIRGKKLPSGAHCVFVSNKITF